MDIAKYISETLEYNDKVAIKGFGTFVKTQKPAAINTDSDNVEPPMVVYTFETLVNQEDCTPLIEHIGRERNLSAPSANYFIENWVDVLMKELEGQTSVDRSPIGYFIKNDQGYIELHESQPNAKGAKKSFFSFLSLNVKSKPQTDSKPKKVEASQEDSTPIPVEEAPKAKKSTSSAPQPEAAPVIEEIRIAIEPVVEVKAEIIAPPSEPVEDASILAPIEPEPHQADEGKSDVDTPKEKAKKVKQTRPPSYIEASLNEDIIIETKPKRSIVLTTALLVILIGLGICYWFYGEDIKSLITSPKQAEAKPAIEELKNQDKVISEGTEVDSTSLSSPTLIEKDKNNTPSTPSIIPTPKPKVTKVNYGAIPDLKMDAKYQIVLGSFSSMDEAAKRLADLKESGYNKGIRVIDNKGKIRLCAGGYDDYTQTKNELVRYYRVRIDKDAWILQL